MIRNGLRLHWKATEKRDATCPGRSPRISGLLLLWFLVCISTSLHAEMPLGRPATLIVPLPPGGATDSIARVLAASVQSATGQVIVVENRSGGSGQVALRALRQAAPDGKTLLIAPFAMAVLGPLTTPNEPFASGRDFAPIGQLAEYSIAFAVGAQVQARTMQEY